MNGRNCIFSDKIKLEFVHTIHLFSVVITANIIKSEQN